jgi:hypothetical protein
MSFLEQFLQESSEQGRSREPINAGRSESSVERKTTGASTLSHGSIESDEPDQDTDVENQIASVASSRSNMSETSVSIPFHSKLFTQNFSLKVKLFCNVLFFEEYSTSKSIFIYLFPF